MRVWRTEAGDDERVLTVVDHASNRVPAGIDLGLDPAMLQTHIGWDIGAAALARALGFPRFLADVSRLVVDFNRPPDAVALVPRRSDGVAIPGNAGDVSDRREHWHQYHAALAQQLVRQRPRILLSLHSFTPQLAEQPQEQRPWQVGVLYNNDARAARIALPLLRAAGLVVGDQQPYSGKQLNYTMDRHAEGNGIPYLGLEVRQDQIADDVGVAHWAALLRPVITACL